MNQRLEFNVSNNAIPIEFSYFILAYGTTKGGKPEGGAAFLYCDNAMRRKDLQRILETLAEAPPGTEETLDLQNPYWSNVRYEGQLEEATFRADFLRFRMIDPLLHECGSVEVSEITKTIHLFLDRAGAREMIRDLEIPDEADSDWMYIGEKSEGIGLGTRNMKDSIIAQVLFMAICSPDPSGYEFDYILRKVLKQS
jgi:hypothetical protein